MARIVGADRIAIDHSARFAAGVAIDVTVVHSPPRPALADGFLHG